MTPAAGATTRRGWTHAEEEALRILSPLGGPACALAFARSLKSVEHKAASLRISLRRRSCGGNPGVTTTATLRRVKELSAASLCPACGFRFVGVAKTGLCGLCHMKRLTAVHQEQIEQADGQRELWAARSKLKRRRRTFAEAEAVSVTETRDAAATMVKEQSTDQEEEATCTR